MRVHSDAPPCPRLHPVPLLPQAEMQLMLAGRQGADEEAAMSAGASASGVGAPEGEARGVDALGIWESMVQCNAVGCGVQAQREPGALVQSLVQSHSGGAAANHAASHGGHPTPHAACAPMQAPAARGQLTDLE